ncbi:MAG: ATP-dependent 6-phosphofructokinase [Endomicrobiales bacterium]
MKKIAVITSGGDAPGMNATVRAVTRHAIYNGLEVLGIHRGFRGLLEDQFTHLNLRSVSGIINRGGTILRTGRCPEMKTESGMNRAISMLNQLNVEGLVVIGGDGSLHAGDAISRRGIPVICVPASIDNDIFGTDETVGFDTALNTAVDAIDKIRDTASSHERVFIVEVMGREHGFLSVSVGVAAGVEFVLVPEVKYKLPTLLHELKEQHHRGKTSVIIVFAEGVGNPFKLAADISKARFEVRVSSLGYIQRGGTPSARSRILASQFGAHAVELLVKGKKNRLVVLENGRIKDMPIAMAAGKEKEFDRSLYDLTMKLAT